MNDTTTTTDTDIMRRWQLLHDDWMRRVEETRGTSADFYGHGAILGRRGQLRMTALSTCLGSALFELSMEPGDTQVRITFPSGDTYLV